jgi:hypothetical protein
MWKKDFIPTKDRYFLSWTVNFPGYAVGSGQCWRASLTINN